VYAAGCEAILGKWFWFTGGVVSRLLARERHRADRGELQVSGV
jgi:hypothetical protein